MHPKPKPYILDDPIECDGMTDNLGDLGQSLHFAFNALATDCTVTGIDELVSRLKTAEQTLTRLRLAMIQRERSG